MAGCLFCTLIAGEAPASVVADTPDGFAFLDARPVFAGHTLVVPRAHVETLSLLPAQDLPGFFALVQKIAAAVETGLAAGGTFVAMNNKISQSVPHLHAHVVPRHKGDGLRGFFWPRSRYASDDEAEAYAIKIRNALAGAAPAAGVAPPAGAEPPVTAS